MTSVDLFPDTGQQQYIDATREALRREFPFNELCRPDRPATLSDRRWAAAVALGWPGCGIPEGFGGAGFGVADEALLFRELGRALVNPSVMAALLGAHCVAPGEAGLLTSFARGEQRVALAIPVDPAGNTGAGGVFVIDPPGAMHALYLAGEQAALLPFAALADLVPVECVDPTLTFARARITSTLPLAAHPGETISVAARARLLLTAQLVGLAEAARDMAVGHAKLREQFGQPIGAFQAIAHHCVDMELRVQAALSQLLFAAIACRDVRPDHFFQLQAALLVASDAAFRNATINIRILGGMGYSEESGAHLFLKRTMVLQAVAGGESRARAALLSAPAAI